MYSWKATRTLCAFLLLIPIVHLAFLVSREMRTTLDTSPEAWAAEVEAYVEADQTVQRPVNPIVVIGGRPVKLWQGLEDVLSPRPVLMRGLGDATVDDITHYHSRLIGYYQPRALVLLPGSSEFHIRDNKSAPELVTAIRKLVELDQSYKVPRHYYIFTPIKTPLYSRDYTRIDETTRLLQQWAETQEQVTILDSNALLTLGNGEPNPDFFRMDGVNLNEHGYLRLSVMLQDRLEQAEGGMYAAGSSR